MIRDQIETMLGIRGKTLPSAADFMDHLANATGGDIEMAWHRLDATDNANQDAATSAAAAVVVTEALTPQKSDDDATNAFLYSDYTEKLQSVFPACT